MWKESEDLKEPVERLETYFQWYCKKLLYHEIVSLSNLLKIHVISIICHNRFVYYLSHYLELCVINQVILSKQF